MRRAKIAKSIADYRHVRNPSVQEVACSAEPGTSAAFREHLEEIEHREYVVHTVNRRTAAPGFYVTARRETREGFQYGFAEGPFELHVEALAAQLPHVDAEKAKQITVALEVLRKAFADEPAK